MNPQRKKSEGVRSGEWGANSTLALWLLRRSPNILWSHGMVTLGGSPSCRNHCSPLSRSSCSLSSPQDKCNALMSPCCSDYLQRKMIQWCHASTRWLISSNDWVFLLLQNIQFLEFREVGLIWKPVLIQEFLIIDLPSRLSCLKHRLLLCWGVTPPPSECPDMTLNNLMVKFQ